MEDPESNNVRRQRIITHMNEAHNDTLTRYLEHYNRLPQPTISHATLSDLTLEYMILLSGGAPSPDSQSRYYIPFNPPLESWDDVRERLIAMDHAALAGLGRSAITVDRYVPPRGFHAVVMAACVCTYLAFYKQANFLPGSWLYDYLLGGVPSFAAFGRRIQPVLFPVMLAVHTTEAVWLDRSRLRRFNVPRLRKLWWLWMGSNFLEGYGAFQRLDRLVERLEGRKKENGKTDKD
ncbi:MAG: hypothetical protein M1816_003354 [Peltula sp. TS41687]|nr:MAG: hypothetical protein M1816_003354 [Peltula sp. TS41687]